MSQGPATDKPDGKLRYGSLILMGLLALLVGSMGPSFHFLGFKGLVPYAPILIPAGRIPGGARSVAWYLNLWAKDGTRVTAEGHGFIVCEFHSGAVPAPTTIAPSLQGIKPNPRAVLPRRQTLLIQNPKLKGRSARSRRLPRRGLSRVAASTKSGPTSSSFLKDRVACELKFLGGQFDLRGRR